MNIRWSKLWPIKKKKKPLHGACPPGMFIHANIHGILLHIHGKQAFFSSGSSFHGLLAQLRCRVGLLHPTYQLRQNGTLLLSVDCFCDSPISYCAIYCNGIDKICLFDIVLLVTLPFIATVLIKICLFDIVLLVTVPFIAMVLTKIVYLIYSY